VDYRVIQVPDQSGRPLKTSSPEVWQELEALLAVDWPVRVGGTMPIMGHWRSTPGSGRRWCTSLPRGIRNRRTARQATGFGAAHRGGH